MKCAANKTISTYEIQSIEFYFESNKCHNLYYIIIYIIGRITICMSK
jgi:fluoride ion exporter CrcB/FEX